MQCLLIAVFVSLCMHNFAEVLAADEVKKESKCKVPTTAPHNIEKAINKCQDEIKLAIISEALEALKDEPTVASPTRAKREASAFNPEEKRIAGCLLQCVYRKRKALDESGYPTIQGLVALYSEGVTDKEYFLATVQSVHFCLAEVSKKYYTGLALEKGKGCDISYDVFDCVADKIGEYCGQSP